MNKTIDLVGKPIKIIYKSEYRLLIVFQDEELGPLLITAMKETCILYGHIELDTSYQLEVIPKQYEDSNGFYHNELVIKKAFRQKEKK